MKDIKRAKRKADQAHRAQVRLEQACYRKWPPTVGRKMNVRQYRRFRKWGRVLATYIMDANSGAASFQASPKGQVPEVHRVVVPKFGKQVFTQWGFNEKQS